MEEVIIRRAKPEDGPGIANVQHKGWILAHVNEALGITEDDINKYLGSIKKTTERFTKSVEGGTPYYVAQDKKGNIIGYAGCYKDGNDWTGGIYLDPKSIGRGIGTKLLNKLFSNFNNNEYFFVGIATFNKASQALFKKFGFTDTGERKNFMLSKSGKSFPLLFMKRQF